jgi:DNA polymerase-3 subunit gamma/tau
MSYVVLARKWRPMKFEDLVGQDHVARTLANAILAGRVAHAFLFTGVRGVGKTTSARILAKALNCMRPPGTVPAGQDPGPTVTPCLECPACLEIAAGTDMDVREIDGASYNGVDEVRKLQDSIPYRPNRDRSKIFIVDEVHMLSQSAWNAFLKTLEEPPPHVKFIFATTEAHKIPITILSRVQRFDFKLIPARLIIERLRFVLAEEGIPTDEAALSIVAREAAGSMRDAMSLLDQVIAWSDSRLEGEGVARVLGVASREVLREIVAALVAGEAERCLGVLQNLVGQGYDMAHVARDLLALLRDLVVARACRSPLELLDLPDQEQKEVIKLASSSELDDLLRLHQGFSQGYDDVVRSGQPRAALEMLLVRLARRPPLWPIDDLLARLGALERRLGSEPSSPSGGNRGPDSAGPGGSRQKARPSAASSKAEQAEPVRPPEPVHVAEPVRPPEAVSPPEPRCAPPTVRSPEPARLPVSGAQSHLVAVGTEQKPLASRSAPPAGVPRVVPDTTGQAATAEPSAGETSDDTLHRWRLLVERLRTRRPDIAAVFDHAAPTRLDGGALELTWAVGDVLREQALDPSYLAELGRAAAAELGETPRISFTSSIPPGEHVTLATMDAQLREAARRDAIARVRNHPRVAQVIELFGARVKEVRLPTE